MAAEFANTLDKFVEEVIPSLTECLNINARRLQEMREVARSSEDPSIERSLEIHASLDGAETQIGEGRTDLEAELAELEDEIGDAR